MHPINVYPCHLINFFSHLHCYVFHILNYYLPIYFQSTNPAHFNSSPLQLSMRNSRIRSPGLLYFFILSPAFFSPYLLPFTTAYSPTTSSSLLLLPTLAITVLTQHELRVSKMTILHFQCLRNATRFQAFARAYGPTEQWHGYWQGWSQCLKQGRPGVRWVKNRENPDYRLNLKFSEDQGAHLQAFLLLRVGSEFYMVRIYNFYFSSDLQFHVQCVR